MKLLLGFFVCLSAGLTWAGSEPSFVVAPFVNPRLLQDLSAWVSDQGNQVLEVDLLSSQASNRYFAQALTRTAQGPAPWVCYESKEQETFCYRWIGRSKGGLDVLRTRAWGGGSMVDERVLILRRESRPQAKVDVAKGLSMWGEARIVLRKLAEIILGDRYSGEVKVKDDRLNIGKDENELHQGANYTIQGRRVDVDYSVDLAPLAIQDKF